MTTPRGVRTTEFWLTLASMAFLLGLVLTDKITAELALAIGILPGTYTVSRGIAKRSGVSRRAGHADVPAEKLIEFDPQAGPRGHLPVWILIGIAIALLGIGVAGCSTTGGAASTAGAAGSTASPLNPRRVEAIATLAAYVGVSADLRAHPEHRAALELASSGLARLVEEERWDAQAAAMAMLPTGLAQMSGAEGAMYISAGLMLTDALGIGQFDARDNAHIEAAIKGLSKGVRLGLDGPGGRGLPDNREEFGGWQPDIEDEAASTRTLWPGRGTP